MNPRMMGILIIAIMLGISAVALAQTPMGTSFSYQGLIKQNGTPFTGSCNFIFSLFAVPTLGTPLGAPFSVPGMAVANGLLNANLDFGPGAFNGMQRWLEIQAQCPAIGGTMTTLNPRQELKTAPYAAFALQAASSPWGGIAGVPPALSVLGSLSCVNGQVPKWSSGSWSCGPDNNSGGTLTGVTASAPLASSGGAAPNISFTGILPIANGGTGSATQNFVDLTTAQGVGGIKTFSSAPSFSAAGTPFSVANSGMVANLNADQLDGKHAASFQLHYQNVRVVAKGGGDYTDPVAAMTDLAAWCAAPTYDNPCLLKIMPGTYDIGSTTLQLRDNVHIEGSGISSTVITGAVDSNTTGLVKCAETELRSLTVYNKVNGGSNAIGIYNDVNWMYLKSVQAWAQGAANAYGLYVTNDALTDMENCIAWARGTTNCYGIYGYASLFVMTNVHVSADSATNSYGLYFYTPDGWIPNIDIDHVTVYVSGSSSGTSKAYGIYNRNYVIGMRDVNVTVYGGTVYNYGIFNTEAQTGYGRLTLKNIVADVSLATTGFGVFNTNTGGDVTLDHSSIKAATNSVRNDNSAAKFYIGASQLDGTPWGTLKCVYSYNGSYAALSSTCGP